MAPSPRLVVGAQEFNNTNYHMISIAAGWPALIGPPPKKYSFQCTESFREQQSTSTSDEQKLYGGATGSRGEPLEAVGGFQNL